MVITAQQPLSTTDLKLLRLLQGVQPDRVVVFVNRIDTLGDIAEDATRVLDRSRSILQKEFPEAEIPLIAGSAWWGLGAMTPEKINLERVLTPSFAAYAEHLGVAPPVEIETLRNDPSQYDIRLREVLYACSGLSQLADLVTSLLLKSAAAETIYDTTDVLRGFARNAAVVARYKLLHQDTPAHAPSETGNDEDEPRALKHLASQARALATELKQFEQDLKALADRVIGDISDRTGGSLKTFIASEVDRLKRQALDGQQVSGLEVDTINLRHKMAQEFMAAYKDAAQKIAAFENEHIEKLDTLLAGAVSDAEICLDVGGETRPPALPSLAPLSRAVALDLDDARRYSREMARRDAKEAIAEFEKLMHEEFLPITEDLVAAAKEAFKTHISAAMRRHRAISRHMLTELSAILQSAPGKFIASEERARIEQEAEHLEELASRLETLSARCSDLRAQAL